jgi:hypothetical protein
MNTIGQRMSDSKPKRSRLQRWWDQNAPLFAAVGIAVGVIAAAIGALFALVYLVTLAVRLAWGS